MLGEAQARTESSKDTHSFIIQERGTFDFSQVIKTGNQALVKLAKEHSLHIPSSLHLKYLETRDLNLKHEEMVYH